MWDVGLYVNTTPPVTYILFEELKRHDLLIN